MNGQTNGAVAQQTTAMAVRGATEIAPARGAVPFFTPDQEKMIRDSFLSGASQQEASMLLEVARVRGLNPLLRQIHFVKRWDSQKQCEVWAYQVSIDGFRLIAERTGRYDGQDEPIFAYDKNGRILSAKVAVYRKDVSRPFVAVAFFAEYVQTKKDGHPNSMWSKMPHVMVAKCAEALALRKAFPEDLSGLYTDDEMAQAESAPSARVQQAAATVERLVQQADARVALPPPSETIDALSFAHEIENAADTKALTDVGARIKTAKAALSPEDVADLLKTYNARLAALKGAA